MFFRLENHEIVYTYKEELALYLITVVFQKSLKGSGIT